MSITDAAADRPAIPSAELLPDDVATLKSMIVELLVTLRDERRDSEGLRHRIDQLLRRLYGPRGERFDPNQLLLFAELAEGQQADTADPPPAQSKRQPRTKPHGRRALPKDLVHVPRHHVLCEADRICPDCGQPRIEIGVDTSKQLDYRPASLFVVQHIVHKYACPCCSKARHKAAVPPLLESCSEQALPAITPQAEPAPSREAEPVPEPKNLEQAEPPQPATRPSAAVMAPPAPQAEPSRPQTPPAGVVVSARKPEMPIAKGLPGPGLLADLIVSKFVEHMPLHRLERRYERQGLFLPRSTTSDWLAACAELLRPLYQMMISVVLQSRVIHTDDTPVNMQQATSATSATRHLLVTARMWDYLGDAAHPYNVFDFTPNHKREGPQQFLANFQGYLQADAFSGYDGLYLPSPRDGLARIIEVACNAHARRKFYDARTSDAAGSHQALAYYAQLYELERRAKELAFDDEQRRRMRQDLAVPICTQFRTWLDAQRADVLPKSPLGTAIQYALNNWTALVRYTEAGYLAIDNNVAEREMKRIAIGRKNWLFVGSLKGGKTAAVLMSFTSTCNRLGVEPWQYLQDVLSRLPTTPAQQLAELLPDRWQAARQAQAATAAAASSAPPAEPAS